MEAERRQRGLRARILLLPCYAGVRRAEHRAEVTGGEAEQVTKLDTDINGFRLMPDGKRLVLAIDVWPDAKTLAESLKKDEQKAKSKVKAHVYDQLLYRHWDQWEDGKYSHLFLWTSDQDLRDLTPGLTTDAPTHPFGGMEQVTVSADGKWLAYVARVGGREIAAAKAPRDLLVHRRPERLPRRPGAHRLDLTRHQLLGVRVGHSALPQLVVQPLHLGVGQAGLSRLREQRAQAAAA